MLTSTDVHWERTSNKSENIAFSVYVLLVEDSTLCIPVPTQASLIIKRACFRFSSLINIYALS